MKLPADFAIKPTFPLDEDELRRQCGFRKLAHPLTWGALIATLALGLIIKASAFFIVVLLGIAVLALRSYWKRNGTKIEREVTREMIRESNRAQDKQLNEIVRRFRVRGLHHYAIPLSRFLLLKQRIESALHSGGGITPQKEQIDKLIDRLCAGVCRQFAKLAEIDEETGRALVARNGTSVENLELRRTEVLRQIRHAYDTIYETQATILDLEAAHELGPDEVIKGAGIVPPPLPSLDRVISQLSEENTIARRVQERLRREKRTIDLDLDVEDRGRIDAALFSKD